MAGKSKRKLSLFDVVDEATNGALKMKVNGGPVLNPYTTRPNSVNYFEILGKRQKLPVWQQKVEFLDILAKNQTMILVGETGSGKTMQIPQFVVEAGYTTNGKQVACTELRKVAAMSVSRRVADEMDVTIGDKIGYNIRFEDCTGPKTIFKYLTDGMLLREAITDPFLERYRVIILNEAHERIWAIDVLFGHLKEVLKNRPDLKLVVMSATLEAKKFQAYFNGALLMKVLGRLHHVEIFYTQAVERDYLEAGIRTVVHIHIYEPPNDILVFFIGEEEIEDACKKITLEVQNFGEQVGPLKAVPLYSTLPPALRKRFSMHHRHRQKREVLRVGRLLFLQT